MKPRAIVVSGRALSGKTALATGLCDRTETQYVTLADLAVQSRTAIDSVPEVVERAIRRLDRETDGRWLANALAGQVLNKGRLERVVVDSVRTAEQVNYLRQGGWSVTHIHLEASDVEIKKRSPPGRRNSAKRRSLPDNPPALRDLAALADVLIDTDRCNIDDVLIRVVARLEDKALVARSIIDVLVGGQYGSEGKGNVANYLAPEYDVLVRVGGPNAGHKVFVPNAKPYTFRQLPSGALANPDATLVIGAGAVISKEVLLREIAELAIPYDKLIIDPQAMIIGRDDIKWEEKNLKSAIGSTAQGIGRATARKILYRIPDKKPVLAGDVSELAHFLADTVDFFDRCIRTGKRILLEGTQGTSLSLHHGHYPHVTSRATTAAACLAEAGLASRNVRRIMMVCRTYPIRVGDSDTGKTSGFMSRVITFADIAKRSGIELSELQGSEIGSVSHRPRRVAEFDWAQLRRSLLLNGPTDIVLTFADYLGIENRKAYRYEQLNDETLRFIEELEQVCSLPVSLISIAFNDRNIIDRRVW